MIKKLLACSYVALQGTALFSQNLSQGQIHGNFQIDAQYYRTDSVIGAPEVPEETLMQGFGNINYTNGRLSAGIRYEAYLNPLLGFDTRYEGQGIPYRYVRYQGDEVDLTFGNFYEQFGNGLILRAYEERNLGYDNAFDGFRVRANPYKGVYLKGVYGTQRVYFEQGEGIVRGIDGEFNLNALLDSVITMKPQITIGASFVSKYEADQNSQFVLPENVGAYAFRGNFYLGNFSFLSEYAFKINDPSADNSFIYKNGNALLLNASYAKRGFAIAFTAKTQDNMSYRSERNAQVNDLFINYLPSVTKQHTYNLTTLYPYAVQPNGEVAFSADLSYKFKKKTALGGKYGTKVSINFSNIFGLDSTAVGSANDTIREGYTTNFFGTGEEYFRDFNIEIKKKISKKLKFTYTFYNFIYRVDVIQGLQGRGEVNSIINVLDVSYKIKKKHNLRIELQHLHNNDGNEYDEDMGDWGSFLAEYTISPHWFFALLDQYNYGNPVEDRQVHYLLGNVGYIKNATRITLGYGRQRAGIFCVGGVCRFVPASNGFSLSMTTSF